MLPVPLSSSRLVSRAGSPTLRTPAQWPWATAFLHLVDLFADAFLRSLVLRNATDHRSRCRRWHQGAGSRAEATNRPPPTAVIAGEPLNSATASTVNQGDDPTAGQGPIGGSRLSRPENAARTAGVINTKALGAGEGGTCNVGADRPGRTTRRTDWFSNCGGHRHRAARRHLHQGRPRRACGARPHALSRFAATSARNSGSHQRPVERTASPAAAIIASYHWAPPGGHNQHQGHEPWAPPAAAVNTPSMARANARGWTPAYRRCGNRTYLW